MFGKDQPHVVNEDDVGDYVAKTHDRNSRKVATFAQAYGTDNELVGSSEEPSNGTQDKS